MTKSVVDYNKRVEADLKQRAEKVGICQHEDGSASWLIARYGDGNKGFPVDRISLWTRGKDERLKHSLSLDWDSAHTIGAALQKLVG